MKSKKSMIFVLVICLMVLMALMFVACNKKQPEAEPEQAPHNHTWATEWSKDATNHWYACSGCSEKKDQAAHVYTDDLDTTCNICGYVRSLAHTHSWASEWSKNDTKHWHACSGCTEKNDEAVHVYDNDHDATCNTCGYVRTLGDHAAASAWTTDGTNHWHACTHDGCTIKFDFSEHAWGTIWSTDGTNHWHECSVCGEVKDIAAHVYSDDHDTTCDTCGYVRSIGDHAAAIAWTIDATHHWHTCAHDGCTIKYNYAMHSFSDGVCTVCGYTQGLQFTLQANEYAVTGYEGTAASVIIPSTYNGKSVTSIGANVFSENTSITSITIPASVTSIGNNAFYNCTGLTAVYYTGDISSWCSITFGTTSYTAANPLQNANNLYINNQLQTEIIIPDTVTEIKARAFDGWNGTTVTIPNTIVTIGHAAFDGCSQLTRVNYTGNIASWCAINFDGGVANPLYYGHNLYINDVLQTNITIPNTVTTINNYAFAKWSGTSVTISSGVTSIGNSAFQICENLSSITIPTSVTNIGSDAFWKCVALTDIYYSGTTTQWEAISKGSGWNNNTGTYTIHCSNEDIPKSL